MTRVLYVDDEPELLKVCKEFLELSGELTVDTATSFTMAEERMAGTKYDAIISEYQIPDMNGKEFLKKLRSKGNQIPFILFTGMGCEEVVIEAFNSGASYYLQKGGKLEAQFKELEQRVKEMVQRREAEETAVQSNPNFDT